MTGFEIAFLVVSIAGVVKSLTAEEESNRAVQPRETAEEKWLNQRVKIGKALVDRKRMVQAMASGLVPGSKPEDFSGGSRARDDWNKYTNENMGGYNPYLADIDKLKEYGKYDELGNIKDVNPQTGEYTRETKVGFGGKDKKSPYAEPVSEDVEMPINTRFVSDEEHPVKYESGQAVPTKRNWVETYMYDEISDSYKLTNREERDMSKWYWSGQDWQRHAQSGSVYS